MQSTTTIHSHPLARSHAHHPLTSSHAHPFTHALAHTHTPTNPLMHSHPLMTVSIGVIDPEPEELLQVLPGPKVGNTHSLSPNRRDLVLSNLTHNRATMHSQHTLPSLSHHPLTLAPTLALTPTQSLSHSLTHSLTHTHTHTHSLTIIDRLRDRGARRQRRTSHLRRHTTGMQGHSLSTTWP